jgi:hypothetical protein
VPVPTPKRAAIDLTIIVTIAPDAKNSRNVKSVTSCSADVFYVPLGSCVHQEDIVIMKTTLAILVLGSLALATSGANAYESKANGYQSYPNYDRQGYQNRSCCNWKSTHKAPHKVVKH